MQFVSNSTLLTMWLIKPWQKITLNVDANTARRVDSCWTIYAVPEMKISRQNDCLDSLALESLTSLGRLLN